MSLQYKDAENKDYNIICKIFDLYTISNCIIKSYLNIDNIFEANEIVDGIYLGNINSAYDLNELKKLGITHIISVLSGFIPPYNNDFKYLVINAYDTNNTDLSNIFEITNQYIDDVVYNKNEKILIHCMAGRSRSVTILAAFIINKFGIDVQNTLQCIKNKRNIINPNKNFINQLENYYTDMYLKIK